MSVLKLTYMRGSEQPLICQLPYRVNSIRHFERDCVEMVEMEIDFLDKWKNTSKYTLPTTEHTLVVKRNRSGIVVIKLMTLEEHYNLVNTRNECMA